MPRPAWVFMEAGVKLCQDTGPGTVLTEVSARPAWKRTLDVALILITAPVSMFVGLGIALFIKLTSRGPVLFRQDRIGLQGRCFPMLKFRTMKVDADNSAHRQYLQSLIASSGTPMTKMDKGDPRLIAGGAILRNEGNIPRHVGGKESNSIKACRIDHPSHGRENPSQHKVN